MRKSHALFSLALFSIAAVPNGQTQIDMYDPEYFPTPVAVIRKMLEPWKKEHETELHRRHNLSKYSALAGKMILDPSAGSGAILKFIADEMDHYDKPHLHAIEINTDMQPTLREKFTLVHDDFLTFDTNVDYDLILMNPPFSNGDEHLLKAWEVLREGDIVCLLNSSTIKLPHTERRKWLKQIIEQHGTVEFLGDVFRHAERKTNADIALVRLKKDDGRDRFQFWPDEEDDETFEKKNADRFVFDDATLNSAPAVNDLMEAMVQQYKLAQDAFVDYMKAEHHLRFYVNPLLHGATYALKHLLEESERGKPRERFNDFLMGLQRQAWDSVIYRTNLHDLMSKSVRKDFDAFRKEQGGMAFTVPNIRSLLQMLVLNRDTILKRCVSEAFDLMTRYHKENTEHWEGWVTNDAYMVKRRVILPSCVTFDWSWGVNHYRHEELVDIDRGLGMLIGKRVSQFTTIVDALHADFKNGGNKRCQCTFFDIKYWKKGTVHLHFRDEDLWMRFNLSAAEGKNWLPGDRMKKERKKRGMSAEPGRPEAQHLLLG